QTRNLNWMQPGQLAARRFQLHRSGVGSEITHVRPIDHLNRATGAEKGRRQTAPQPGQAHVRACDAPLIRALDNLDIIHARDTLAIDADELLIEHITGLEHFAVAPHERTQIENVRGQAHALFAKLRDSPARKEKITAPVPGDKTRNRWVLILAESHNDIFQGRHTFTIKVEYGPTQYLRQIKHSYSA